MKYFPRTRFVTADPMDQADLIPSPMASAVVALAPYTEAAISVPSQPTLVDPVDHVDRISDHISAPMAFEPAALAPHTKAVVYN